METGLWIKFGRPIYGREQKAMDLYGETKDYFVRLLGEGTVTFFEPFLIPNQVPGEPVAFFVVKAPVTGVFKLMEDELFHAFRQKALYLFEGFTVDFLTVGEEIPGELASFAKVQAEIGIIR
jgi:hypothetical protein